MAERMLACVLVAKLNGVYEYWCLPKILRKEIAKYAYVIVKEWIDFGYVCNG
jgi:NDP-sugar pyrophosphorylase family protein